jgi:hypothetical protein
MGERVLEYDLFEDLEEDGGKFTLNRNDTD